MVSFSKGSMHFRSWGDAIDQISGDCTRAELATTYDWNSGKFKYEFS